MTDHEHKDEDAHGLHWAKREAGEVVYICGAARETGISETYNDWVVGEVPKEGGSRPAHSEAAAEDMKGAKAP